MNDVQLAKEDKSIDDYEDGYIIAGDGFYEKKTTAWLTHMTKVDEVPGLPLLKDKVFLSLKMPKMPMGIILDAWKFFREVNKVHSGEAVGLIVYDDVNYRFIIPDQEVSGASLSYDSTGVYNVIGTIHSHNTMSAFHSSTDDKDEAKFDGIHITLGNVDKISFPSISCSVTKNGERFMFSLDSMIDFSDDTSSLDLDEAMKKVSTRKASVIYGNKTVWGDYSRDKTLLGIDRQTTLNGNLVDDSPINRDELPGGDFSEWVDKIRGDN